MKAKPKSFKTLFAACIIIFGTFTLKAALCTNIANGDWNTVANWSCGHKPTCGDSIVIKAGTTVTITTQQDYSACGTGPILVIYGTLKFDNGNKLKLPCNSRIYIMAGGSIRPGTGGGNSNNIEICNDVLWQAGDGTLTGPSCLPPNASWCIGTVLPVELIHFTGVAKEGYVDLEWSTASEKNSDVFEIENSLDAIDFKKFTSVNSKALNGNSNAVLHYSAADESPLGNICYYRIKQLDKDNTFSYSSVISVNYIKAKNIKFVVYPNPNKGEFVADISGIENNHEITLSLRDEKGQIVYNSSFFIQDQTSSKLQIIPENKLTSGIYVCILTIEGIQYHVKVIVS